MLYDLPYPDDTFDFIHISFFVYVFRNEEWPTAIKEAIRVIKLGADIFYINYQKIVPLLFTSIEAQIFLSIHQKDKIQEFATN